MKKSLLLSMLVMLLGWSGFTAKAEVVNDYVENFVIADRLPADDGKSIGSYGTYGDYHPAFWGRLSTSSYGSFSAYYYYSSEGHDGDGFIDNTVYSSTYDLPSDWLITPLVKGKVSFWVRKAKSYSYSTPMINVYVANEAGSAIDDEKPLLKWYGYENSEYELHTLTTEWEEVTLEIEDWTRLAIAINCVGLDDFHAEQADLVATTKMTAEAVCDKMLDMWLDENNQVTANMKITVKNSGETTLLASDPDFRVDFVHRSYYHLEDEENGFTQAATYKFDEDVAPGETKVFEAEITFTIDPKSIDAQLENKWWQTYMDVFERKGDKYVVLQHLSDYGYATTTQCSFKKYEPVFQFTNAFCTTARLNQVSALHCPVHTGRETSSVSVNVSNTAGKAPMTLSKVSVTDGFTVEVEDGVGEIKAGESKKITVTSTSTEIGRIEGTVTVEVDGMDPKEIKVISMVLDESKWSENFEGVEFEEEATTAALPEGFIGTDWLVREIDERCAAEGTRKAAANFTYTNGKIITPMLKFEENEPFRFSLSMAGTGASLVTIYYSTDRENWTELAKLNSYQEDLNRCTVQDAISDASSTYRPYGNYDVEMPEGSYYIAIQGYNMLVDNLNGGELVVNDVDLYSISNVMPTEGKQNYRATAEFTVRNLGVDIPEGGYTATLYVDSVVVATGTYDLPKAEEPAEPAEGEEGEEVEEPAAPAVPAEPIDPTIWLKGADRTFKFAFTPHEYGVHKVYAEVTVGNITRTTPEVSMNIKQEIAALVEPVGTVGTDQSSFGIKPATKYETKIQCVYPKAWFKNVAAGTALKGMQFYGYEYYSNSQHWDKPIHVKIYMENATDVAAFPSYDPTYKEFNENALVFDGDVTYEPATRTRDDVLVDVNLDTDFVYGGNDVIMTLVIDQDETWNGSTVYFARCSDYTYSKHALYNSIPWYSTEMSYTTSYPLMFGAKIELPVATVSGIITSQETGEPLAGAVVRVTGEDDVYYEATSDEDGKYSVGIIQIDRDYNLTAKCEDYVDYVDANPVQIADIDGEAIMKTRRDFAMEHGTITISGKVVFDGEPIEGATVTLDQQWPQVEDGEPLVLTTDKDGVWSFSTKTFYAYYMMTIQAEGFKDYDFSFCSENFDMDMTTDEVMYFVMERDHYIVNGVVTDTKGNPVANATIKLVDADGNEYTATTDENGNYSVVVKTFDAEHSLTVVAEGYELHNTTVALEGIDDVELDDIALQASFVTVEGVVTAGDAPAEGVTVTLTPAEGDAITVTTDADGHYAFDHVAINGEYTLDIADVEGYEAYSEVVNVETEDVTVNVELESGIGSIYGTTFTVKAGVGCIDIYAPAATSVVVCDINGRIIKRATIEGGLHIAGLHSGVYMVNNNKVLVK